MSADPPEVSGASDPADPTLDPSGPSPDPDLAEADPAPDPDGPGRRPGAFSRGWRALLGLDAPRDPRERTRQRAIVRGVVAATVLIVGASFVRLPLLVLSPGPTYNTIGEVDGTPMIVITDTTTYPTEGNLDMLTVSERGGSSGGVPIGEALAGWLAPHSSVVPRESVYGPDVPRQEIRERNDQLFADSQSNSVAAAMRELDIAVVELVVVSVVVGGGPADGIVRAGDEILAVNGTKVTKPADVGAQVRKGNVGDTVELEVVRTEKPGDEPTTHTLEVVAQANPQTPQGETPAPYLGIVVGLTYDAPFPIDFTLENVGGPSAGMMFSLAIVDMLTPGPINGGKHVAGTGAIDPEGNVSPIGGIQQKLVGAQRAGAQLFLAPAANCSEVVGHEPDGMRVVAVETLHEARADVEAWVKDPNAQLRGCAAVLAG